MSHTVMVHDWLNKVHACTALSCWTFILCVKEMLVEAVGEIACASSTGLPTMDGGCVQHCLLAFCSNLPGMFAVMCKQHAVTHHRLAWPDPG